MCTVHIHTTQSQGTPKNENNKRNEEDENFLFIYNAKEYQP